jgi:hypothetical protein
MSLNFVSTGILSSDDGINFNKEEKVESEEQRKARQAKELSNQKSLYDRLREQREAKQAEYDEARRFMHVSRGLDDDDVGYYKELEGMFIMKLKSIEFLTSDMVL